MFSPCASRNNELPSSDKAIPVVRAYSFRDRQGIRTISRELAISQSDADLCERVHNRVPSAAIRATRGWPGPEKTSSSFSSDGSHRTSSRSTAPRTVKRAVTALPSGRKSPPRMPKRVAGGRPSPAAVAAAGKPPFSFHVGTSQFFRRSSAPIVKRDVPASSKATDTTLFSCASIFRSSLLVARLQTLTAPFSWPQASQRRSVDRAIAVTPEECLSRTSCLPWGNPQIRTSPSMLATARRDPSDDNSSDVIQPSRRVKG